MKLILTHKRQLKRRGDVSRFLSYCYGKSLSRPVVPIEGFFPGLPSGDCKLDARLLLAAHHGGKASKARSVAFSSEYFPSYDDAVAHAPAFPRLMSAFREQWAPNSDAISVVHLTEGTGNWRGHWRLDGHLIISNSTGRAGIQWSRQQCQEMQDFAWLPQSLTNEFGIQSGKGKGTTKRRGSLPYPKTGLISFEVGCLTDYELELKIQSGTYGAARRAKTGRVISIEVAGRRINIQRARELVSVRDTGPRVGGVLLQKQSHTRDRNGRMAGAGLTQKRNHPLPSRRIAIRLGFTGKGRGIEDHFLFQRRWGVSAHSPERIAGSALVHYQRILDGHGQSFPVATRCQTRAGVGVLANSAQALIESISEMEDAEIFR